ncbi:MAG TPA: hypothetical protein VGT41_04360 [Candidatus Babeliales bacterium]|nr:hypothetical protein [Candidatus Babeliales bacterium]
MVRKNGGFSWIYRSLIIALALLGPVHYSFTLGSAEHKATSGLSYVPMGYKDVANYYLPSFGVKSFINHDSWEVTDFERRAIVFSMLDQYEQTHLTQGKYIERESVASILKDLHIFCGKNDPLSKNDELGNHLFARINKTETVFGEAVLAHMVANPVRDIQTLQDRQEFIQALINDPAFYTQVEQVVEELKGIEENIIPIWKSRRSIIKGQGNHYYFTADGFKDYNTNQYMLEFRNRFFPLLTASRTILLSEFLEATFHHWLHQTQHNAREIGIVIAGLIGLAGGKLGANEDGTPQDLTPYKIPALLSIFGGLLKKAWFSTVGENRDEKDIFGQNFSGPTMVGHLMHFSQMLLFYYGKYEAVKGIYNSEVTRREFLKGLKGTLVGTKQLFTTFELANKTLKQHNFMPIVDKQHALRDFFLGEERSESLQHLKQLLKTNTFKKDTGISFFPPHMGRILVAYKHVDTVRADLVGPLQVLGQLDAYLSIAKLYKEYKDERVSYSFAQYSNAKLPYFQATDSWNPFVDTDKAVVNDVELGIAHGMRGMILTGSNMGGKSTILKGSALDIWLAQSLTIAPGELVKLTPFGYLGSSLNVADFTGKASSYKAEGLRAQSLLRGKNRCDEDLLGLFIIDELYKGTHADYGAEQCCLFAKELLECPYVLFIFASHFTPRINDLELETEGACENWKVDAIKQPGGGFELPHKLARGVSTVNIAAEIVNQLMADIPSWKEAQGMKKDKIQELAASPV